MSLRNIQCEAIHLSDRRRIVNAALQSGVNVSELTIKDIEQDRFCWFRCSNMLAFLDPHRLAEIVSIGDYIKEIYKWKEWLIYQLGQKIAINPYY